MDNVITNGIRSPNPVVSVSTNEHVLPISNRIQSMIIINQFSAYWNHDQKKDWRLQEPFPKASQYGSRRKCNKIRVLRLKVVNGSCQAVCCMNRIAIGE